MKEKNLPLDNNELSLEELTNQANEIVELLENERDLNNSKESYQKLLKLNEIIEKKFNKDLKIIIKKKNQKLKEIKEKT
tara:strand:- start:463 stop:699 length:237 start_codon:yes stop_codon:yes gene_type:complete